MTPGTEDKFMEKKMNEWIRIVFGRFKHLDINLA